MPCVHCGKLVGVSLMKRHVQGHAPDSEKRFKCDVCGKGFVDINNFKDHMNIHTGEKPYKCKFCTSCFASKGNHAQHEKSHLGHKRNYAKK